MYPMCCVRVPGTIADSWVSESDITISSINKNMFMEFTSTLQFCRAGENIIYFIHQLQEPKHS